MRYRIVNLGQEPMPTPGVNATGPAPAPGKALCITVGPASQPDPKKVSDFLQAQPAGSFWQYPKTSIGPGDQDYIVWCNAYATPAPGAVPWSPSAAGAAAMQPTATPAAAPAAGPLIVGGLAAAGLLAFLALR